MTLSTEKSSKVYNGNGVTDTFTFPYKFFAASHLTVTVDDVVKTDGVHYNVTGVGLEVGGDVIFTVGNIPPVGVNNVEIERILPLTQDADPQNFDGNPADSTEAVYDTITMLVQQVNDLVLRTPKFPAGSTTVSTVEEPVNNNYVIWDGVNLVNGGDASEIANAQGYAIAAAASAADAAAFAVLTDADATATAADRVQTGLDVIQTGLDVIATAADVVLTGFDVAATNADVVTTNADAIATAADVILTNADAAQTALDVIATAADRVQTGLDATATAADVVTTNADVVSTAANAAAAASSAAEGLYQNVEPKAFGDSPIVPLLLEEGWLFKIDTSGGNVIVNLSALSVYGEDMKFAFAKDSGDANTITINRGGTDLISGLTSVVIGTQWETHVLVGDNQGAGSDWIDTVQTTGIADGSVTNAKLADMVQATMKGRAAGAGTGVPVDLTAAQVRDIIGDATTSQKGLVEKATGAEMTSGTADKFPDAAEVKTFVEANSAVVLIDSVDDTATVSTIEFIDVLTIGHNYRAIIPVVDDGTTSSNQLQFSLSSNSGSSWTAWAQCGQAGSGDSVDCHGTTLQILNPSDSTSPTKYVWSGQYNTTHGDGGGEFAAAAHDSIRFRVSNDSTSKYKIGLLREKIA